MIRPKKNTANKRFPLCNGKYFEKVLYFENDAFWSLYAAVEFNLATPTFRNSTISLAAQKDCTVTEIGKSSSRST